MLKKAPVKAEVKYETFELFQVTLFCVGIFG